MSPFQGEYGLILLEMLGIAPEWDVISLCGKSGSFSFFFAGPRFLLLLCLSSRWVEAWHWVWKWPRIPRQSIWDLMIFPQTETNQLPFLGALYLFLIIQVAIKTTVTKSCALNKCLLFRFRARYCIYFCSENMPSYGTPWRSWDGPRWSHERGILTNPWPKYLKIGKFWDNFFTEIVVCWFFVEWKNASPPRSRRSFMHENFSENTWHVLVLDWIHWKI